MPFFWRRRKSKLETLHRTEPADLVSTPSQTSRTRSQPASAQQLPQSRVRDSISAAPEADSPGQIVRYEPRNKRHTSYTDTTIKSIDTDARTIKVRRSGFIFSPKPTLRYSQDFSYPRTPEGQLPTLRRKLEASPFVDDIADELDTSALREVLETDSRRRQRRQSKLIGSATSGTSHPAIGSSVPGSASRRMSLSRPPVPVLFQAQQGGTFRNEATLSNPITGHNADWHEASSINPAAHARIMQDAQVVLAGNRDSYPDFAINDKTERVDRPSSRASGLNGAWTSLWKRAGTARARKERDVASHYGSSSARNTATQPMSDTSSVLYTDAHEFDQEPQQATIMVLHHPQQRASVQAEHEEEGEELVQRVPRAEHFEPRPQPAEMLVTQRELKTFSPLLDGDAFPRPPSQTGHNGIVLDGGVPTKMPAPDPPVQVQPQSIWQRAYATPAEAAGLSPGLPPRKAFQISLLNGHAKDIIRPDETVLGDAETRAVARQSVQSLQLVDSEGSWLGDRTSHLDIMVKRSFSRKYEKGISVAEDAKSRQTQIEDGEGDWTSVSERAEDMADASEVGEVSTPDDNDDEEYEHGVWKTGIGKPVKIVSAPNLMHADGLPITPTVAMLVVPEVASAQRNLTENVSPRTLTQATFAPAVHHVHPIASEDVSPGTPGRATFAPVQTQVAYVQPLAKDDMDERGMVSRATTRNSFVSAVSFATDASESTIDAHDYVYADRGVSRASMATSQASYHTARLAPESRASEVVLN